MTNTYAILELSKEAFEEIREKMRAAGYGDACAETYDGVGIVNMQGVVLRGPKNRRCPNCGITTADADVLERQHKEHKEHKEHKL